MPQSKIPYGEANWTPTSQEPCSAAERKSKLFSHLAEVLLFLPCPVLAVCSEFAALWTTGQINSSRGLLFHCSPHKSCDFPSKLSQGTCEISLVFLEHAAIGCCLSTNGLLLDSGRWLIMTNGHSRDQHNKKGSVKLLSLLIYCKARRVDLLASVCYLSVKVLHGPTA